MSRPQIELELGAVPSRFADRLGALAQRWTVKDPARSIPFSADPDRFHVVHPGRIGGEFFKDQSTSRDAFLGHCAVSLPPSVADQLATEEFAGVGQSFSNLRKASADGRIR